MPCGRFYANAAWWRLNGCYNVISIMTRMALPKSFLAVADESAEISSDWTGKVVSHARMTFRKITEGFIVYGEARIQLVEFSSAQQSIRTLITMSAQPQT